MFVILCFNIKRLCVFEMAHLDDVLDSWVVNVNIVINSTMAFISECDSSGLTTSSTCVLLNNGYC